MRTSAVLILAAFVARTTASSNYTYTFPAGFNLAEVNDQTREQWCLGERNTCPQICGGTAYPNSCDPTTLDFECTCTNGTSPDVSLYTNTIPFYVCEETYVQCIANNPNDLDAQKQCKANETCGTLTASVPSATSTTASSAASSTSTLAMAASSGATSASASAATATATHSSGAAMALHASQDHSVGFFAAGALAVFGLML